MFVYLCILLHGYWQVEKAQSLFRLIFNSDWLSFLGKSESLKILISEWISLLGIIAVIYSESLVDDSFADDDIILNS